MATKKPMYSDDITQDVTPAQADPGTMMRANAMSAESDVLNLKAVGQVVEAAGTAYKTDKFMEMRQLQVDSEQLLYNFHTTNEAAMKAGQLANTLDLEAENMITRAMADPNHDPASIDVINGLKKQVDRLRTAAQGGMSRATYESRVSALSKQAIAKYPGLADDIRQVVGGITGLPGAERWAATQFVNRMFSAQQANDNDAKLAAKFEEDEINMIVGALGTMSKLDVLAAKSSNPQLYATMKQSALERTATAAQAEASKKQLEQIHSSGNLTAEALAPSVAPLARGLMAGAVLPQYQNMVVNDATFLGMVNAVKNGTFDPLNFERETNLLVANLKAGADKGRLEAMRELEKQRAVGKWDDATHKRLQQVVDDEYKYYSALFDDKNAMTAIATVESKWAKETTDQKERLIRLSTEAMRMYDPTTIYNYFHNPDSLPPAIKADLDSHYLPTVNLRRELQQQYSKPRQSAQLVLQQAEKEGGDVTLPDDEESSKLAVESLAVKAKQNIDELGKTGIITNTQANTIKAMVAVSNKTGGNADILRKDFAKYQVALAKLPPHMLNEVKGTISNSTAQLFEEIKKEDLSGLTFGYTPQGKIMAILPDIEPDSAPNTPEVMRSIAERTRAFNRKYGPALDNVVLTRQLVDAGDSVKFAKEYAEVLSKPEPYKGFFSTKPIPATPAISPSEMQRESRGATAAPKPAAAPAPAATSNTGGNNILDGFKQLGY